VRFGGWFQLVLVAAALSPWAGCGSAETVDTAELESSESSTTQTSATSETGTGETGLDETEDLEMQLEACGYATPCDPYSLLLFPSGAMWADMATPWCHATALAGGEPAFLRGSVASEWGGWEVMTLVGPSGALVAVSTAGEASLTRCEIDIDKALACANEENPALLWDACLHPQLDTIYAGCEVADAVVCP
jgi:hypothetical protein